VVRTCWRVKVVDGFAGDADGDWRAKDPGKLAGVRVREVPVMIESDTAEQERKEEVCLPQPNLRVDGSNVRGPGGCERETRSGIMRYIYWRSVSY
jgi:hypothetical protein